MTEADILDIIKSYPGIPGILIYSELVKRSRAAEWFGEDAFLTALFGPSIGGMHVKLWALEERGTIVSEWGSRPIGSKYRQRRYWLTAHSIVNPQPPA